MSGVAQCSLICDVWCCIVSERSWKIIETQKSPSFKFESILRVQTWVITLLSVKIRTSGFVCGQATVVLVIRRTCSILVEEVEQLLK